MIGQGASFPVGWGPCLQLRFFASKLLSPPLLHLPGPILQLSGAPSLARWGAAQSMKSLNKASSIFEFTQLSFGHLAPYSWGRPLPSPSPTTPALSALAKGQGSPASRETEHQERQKGSQMPQELCICRYESIPKRQLHLKFLKKQTRSERTLHYHTCQKTNKKALCVFAHPSLEGCQGEGIRASWWGGRLAFH